MKNNQVSLIRSPEFSPPPNTRKNRTSSTEQILSNCESQSVLRSYDAERKRRERATESEQRHRERLSSERMKRRDERATETEQHRLKRRDSDRIYKQNMRKIEDRNQRKANLAKQQKQLEINRIHKAMKRKHQIMLNEYVWPAAIPKELKEYCLQDFCNQTSMSSLRRTTCISCNAREFVNTMKEYMLEDICKSNKLSCHTDISDIVRHNEQNTQNMSMILIFVDICLSHFAYRWKR